MKMKAEWTNKDVLTQNETTGKSKAILVIDMPKHCFDHCPLEYDAISCNCADPEDVIGDEELSDKERPSWCQLRPLPKRKEVHYTDPLFGEVENLTNIGYNKCLDEILGGEEDILHMPPADGSTLKLGEVND